MEIKKKKKKSRTREQIKAEKELLKSLYEKLMQFAENPRIVIAHSAYWKIEQKVYKIKAVKDMVNACEWFLEHYPDLHTCRITYIGSQCRLVLTDSEKREFMHYLFSGSKVNIHEDDYKMYVNYDIQRGIYDDAHYIVDVPHVSSKNKPPQKTEE